MKNILIVGATKGIGLATAQILKHENNLYTVSRNSSEESQRENHFVLDVTKDNLDALNNLPNELHGIAYCPGSINLKGFNRLTIEDFLNDFNQNVVGAIKTIQFCLPRLKNAKNASIVMYSTVAVGTGMNFHSSVATSKAAVEGLAKSLAAEFAGSNIRVNAIAPSLTNTPLAAALLSTPEKIDASNKRHPLQRIGTAEDIAEMTAFLLSDKATWITGQVMHVDGGMGTLK